VGEGREIGSFFSVSFGEASTMKILIKLKNFILIISFISIIQETYANWGMVTTMEQEDGIGQFCVSGFDNLGSFRVFLDEVEVSDDLQGLVDAGEASIYEYDDEICLRVIIPLFTTSKTLRILQGDKEATWQLSQASNSYDSSLGGQIKDDHLFNILPRAPKDGDTCVIDRPSPSIPCTGCANAACGSWLDSANPYPCCDNNNDKDTRDYVDGKCEWWAARSARFSWGFYPYWGEANNWRSMASLDERVSVGALRPGETGLYLDPAKPHVAWVTGLVRNEDGAVQIEEMNCGTARYTGTWKLHTEINRKYYTCESPWATIQPLDIPAGVTKRWIMATGKDFVYKIKTNRECATGVWTDVKGLIWNLYQKGQTIEGTFDVATCGMYKVNGSVSGGKISLLAQPATVKEDCCNASFVGNIENCSVAKVHFRNYCTGNHGDMVMTKRGL
jgi:surface antigen